MATALRRLTLLWAAGCLLLQGCVVGAQHTAAIHPAPLAEAAAVEPPALPAPRPVPQLVAIDLDLGRRLHRNGETDRARQVFEALLERGPDQAAGARLHLGLLALDGGELQRATTHFQAVVRDHPSRPERTSATYLLGRVHQRQDDARGAIRWYEEYLTLTDLLAAQVRVELADLYKVAGAPERAVAEAERALAAPHSRRVQIEALERLAVGAAERNDLGAAQRHWERILPLAATPTYRAEVQWQLAALDRRRGADDAAVERWRTVVVEFPATRRAPEALRALNEHGRADAISHYQAALVRYLHRDNERALGGFEAQLAQGGSAEELAGAAWYRGLTLQRLNREAAARTAFEELATLYPASPRAPDALYRAARLLEGGEAYTAAAEAYGSLRAAHPESDAGQLAGFRAGFSLYRAGRLDEALAAWEAALASLAPRTVRNTVLGPPTNPRASALYWSGKLLQQRGRAAEGRTRWTEAVAAGSDDFYGLRASAMLAGDGNAPLAGITADRLAPPGTDAALAAWLGRWGADATALANELAADAGWRRGTALWTMGRRTEAVWEWDDLRARHASDPPRLYTLGSALQRLGADYQALAVARDLWTASGAPSVYELPRAVRALLFPAPYADLVVAEAQRFGVDPLLLLALIRQESAFDPRAESSARARGLTQVIPSTGRDIARALGYSGLDDDDLFKPVVSVEFGAHYLAGALRQFRGDLYAALAGYNAGPGTAGSWLRLPGGSDPDLYAEQIPYAETSTYVRRVYENYRLYRDLYGGS